MPKAGLGWDDSSTDTSDVLANGSCLATSVKKKKVHTSCIQRLRDELYS
jgi:hypothetical protein